VAGLWEGRTRARSRQTGPTEHYQYQVGLPEHGPWREQGETAAMVLHTRRASGGAAMTDPDHLRVETSYPHQRHGSDPMHSVSPMGREIGGGGEIDLRLPDKMEEFDLVGTLFKRRGGWGKHLGWKYRAFALYQGRLMGDWRMESYRIVGLSGRVRPVWQAFFVTTRVRPCQTTRRTSGSLGASST
jgi:hypothetical protein